MHILGLLLLAGSVAAYPKQLLRRDFSGVATFNNYAAQGNTVCGGMTGGASGIYGAAAGDISPDISGGLCSGSVDMSQCAGQGPIAGYVAPSCPKTNCGKCYIVTNKGGMGGASVSGVGTSIMVKIIDACPSTSAQNFCKTNVAASQRCTDPGTNQLDIDTGGYQALTGVPFGGGANLVISITPSDCTASVSGTSSSANGQSHAGSQPLPNVVAPVVAAVVPAASSSAPASSPPAAVATSGIIPITKPATGATSRLGDIQKPASFLAQPPNSTDTTDTTNPTDGADDEMECEL